MKGIGRILLLIALCLAGCSADSDQAAVSEARQTVSAGQEVNVDYTCRFEEKGPVLATTSRDIASDEGYFKSSLFRSPEKPGPVTIKAGEKNVAGIAAKKFVLNLEEYITEALAQEIVGMPLGTTRTVTLKSESQTHIPREERILKLATVRKRPKDVTVGREYFEARYPVAPEAGKSLPVFKDYMNCAVTEVTEETVSYECKPLEKDGQMMTSFGPATFIEKEHGYDMVLHPEEGDLIRTAGMLGRIAQVGPKVFTVDYTEPFGGKELICEIAVKEPEEDASPEGSTVEAAEKEPGPTPSAAEKTAGDPSETADATGEGTSADMVEEGDMVQVEYTATLKDGKLVRTTREELARDEDRAKVDDFSPDEVFGPELVIAGKKAGFPGVGTSVVGMSPGESKQTTLTPQEAYGPVDEQKVMKVPRVRSFDKKVHVQARDYVNRFDTFPKEGDVVSVNPYLEGVIAEVKDKTVLIDLRPKKKEFEEEFGRVRLDDKEETIDVILEPEIGAEFKQDRYAGRIVSKAEDGFEVNFNHPLAGKEILLDLAVKGLTKKHEFQGRELKWLEDYDKGLEAAKREDKPMALVFYAEQCGWCKKLLNETMTDPRVTRLKDKYVWVKADVKDTRNLADKYELTGTPLTVLLSPGGEVQEKMNGYKNAADMSRSLLSALGPNTAEKQI